MTVFYLQIEQKQRAIAWKWANHLIRYLISCLELKNTDFF